MTEGLIPHAPVASDAVALMARNIQVVREPEDASAWLAPVIVGIVLHNNRASIRAALISALNQDLRPNGFAVLILDDGSIDSWMNEVPDLLESKNVVVLQANCGSPARARNAVLDYVDMHFKNARWVARLDGDDAFSAESSLRQACELGDRENASYVLGGNRLVIEGDLSDRVNPASQLLKEPEEVLGILKGMADGSCVNELPSCNLLLRAGIGFRYPDNVSAEDHRLVAQLLLLHAEQGAILEHPYFIDYRLNGGATMAARSGGDYLNSREKLFEAARVWASAKKANDAILGYGNEGIVLRCDNEVIKQFYPGAISAEGILRVESILQRGSQYLPEAVFTTSSSYVSATYAYEPTNPVTCLSAEEAEDFLLDCLSKRYVCLNIKRMNFRRRPDGSLLMIDVGMEIVDFNISYFIDSAARMYAISKLQWKDGELLRRVCGKRPTEAFSMIPGFSEFYQGLLRRFAQEQCLDFASPLAEQPKLKPDVTLMIKACAMDAAQLESQVKHIVASLAYPADFVERILVLDPYCGPFLRQHTVGDFDALLVAAKRLQKNGWIGRVLVAPQSVDEIAKVNSSWFGHACRNSHSIRDIPVSPQVWGFDQIETRYVLQCDVDILLGRRDWQHDYLQDMLKAITQRDAVGVAFNIPKPECSNFDAYHAGPGEFVPEVRCGLLDLERIRALKPLPNYVCEGRLALSWYRSLQQAQIDRGFRTLRGGDPSTFYIHPPNTWKQDATSLERIRNLVEQAQLPVSQFYDWDLVGSSDDWNYPVRDESIVFLIKGRNTNPGKIERCIHSLHLQDDQGFGVIIIDDNSDQVHSVQAMSRMARSMSGRATFIRNSERIGHLANINHAVSEICMNSESLIVILDMDDVLMRRSVVSNLKAKQAQAHDVVVAGCYRPDKPFKVYSPDFDEPRKLGGGDVWIHLRSFRKKLYEQLELDVLKLDGRWIDRCTDYALMIPIVELAINPTYIPDYLYWHERSSPMSIEYRLTQDQIIRRILAKEYVQISKNGVEGSQCQRESSLAL